MKSQFKFIIVDECHRSIYGKWKAVLDYFSGASVLGLTATPTPEAYAYFNNNIIEEYTYDDSVVDGVNVPSRIYRIRTEVTEHGGEIKEGTSVIETSRKTGKTASYVAEDTVIYEASQLDRSVTNKNQIRKVLTAYKDSIYTDLYPDRKENWAYIPKTLIFAKDDNHASEIVAMAKEVFKDSFDNGEVSEHFVQKITYSSGDSNALIRDFRTEKDFRIAVTVTLVATGTDVRPLEVVLFMKDVHSDVLYTQMKGRGCRIISDDKLREVTPNADTKECYYIVDAVGVTEGEKYIPKPNPGGQRVRAWSLEALLERMVHGELSDENMILLRDYCSMINRRYEDNILFGRHLDAFIDDYGYSPKFIADKINRAISAGTLPQYVSPSDDNSVRMRLISILLTNINARKKLVEMHRGYRVESNDNDSLIYAGFSKETAKSFIENFEKYLQDNKDSIEALRILYNSEDTAITHSMLIELRDRLLAESSQYGVRHIWRNYQILDSDGSVDELDIKSNTVSLTELIQIVKYAYKKSTKLQSILKGYASRFSLYVGQNQRILTEDQKNLMKQIADYIIEGGSITSEELNQTNTDLWRKAVTAIGGKELNYEMQVLTRFILKVA